MRLFCLKNNLYLFFHRLPAEEELRQEDSNMDVTPSREVSHATSEGDSGVFDNCSSHDQQRLGVVMNRLQVPSLTFGHPTMGLTQRVGLAAAIPSLSTSLSISTLQQESRKMSLSLLTHLKVNFAEVVTNIVLIMNLQKNMAKIW